MPLVITTPFTASITPYATLITDQGASYYYKLDESTAQATMVDSSGNGFDGTYDAQFQSSATFGQPTLVNGEPTCIDFSTCIPGADAGAGLQSDNIESLSLWFRHTATDSAYDTGYPQQQIFDAATDSVEIGLRNSEDPGVINFPFVYETNDLVMWPDRDYFLDGEIHHLVLQWNGTAMEMWIDGIKQKRTYATNIFTATSGQFNIGSNGAGNIHFIGEIDEVAMWDTTNGSGGPLTQNQIGAQMTSGKGEFFTDPQQTIIAEASTVPSITGNIVDISFDRLRKTWMAVTGAGEVLTSTDGNTWTAQTSLPAGLSTVNAVAGWNRTWVAVGTGTGNKAVSNDDGQTWNLDATFTNTLNDIIYGEDVGIWIAVGPSERAERSTDNGASWTNVAPPSGDIQKIVRNGPFWYAGTTTTANARRFFGISTPTRGTVYSTDGSSWNAESTAAGHTNVIAVDFPNRDTTVSNRREEILVSNDASSPGRIEVSPSGGPANFVGLTPDNATSNHYVEGEWCESLGIVLVTDDSPPEYHTSPYVNYTSSWTINPGEFGNISGANPQIASSKANVVISTDDDEIWYTTNDEFGTFIERDNNASTGAIDTICFDQHEQKWLAMTRNELISAFRFNRNKWIRSFGNTSNGPTARFTTHPTTGNSFNAMRSHANTETMFAVGDSGRIYYSSNYGVTWTVDNSATAVKGGTVNWNDVRILNGGSISSTATGYSIVCGENGGNGEILRYSAFTAADQTGMTKTGADYRRVATGDDAQIIVSNAGATTCAYSGDHGATWSDVTLPAVTYAAHFAFAGQERCFALGGNGVIYASTVGGSPYVFTDTISGATWSSFNVDGASGAIIDIVFSVYTGWIAIEDAGGGTYNFYTAPTLSDTWTTLLLPNFSGIPKIDVYGNEHVAIVTSTQKIYTT